MVEVTIKNTSTGQTSPPQRFQVVGFIGLDQHGKMILDGFLPPEVAALGTDMAKVAWVTDALERSTEGAQSAQPDLVIAHGDVERNPNA